MARCSPHASVFSQSNLHSTTACPPSVLNTNLTIMEESLISDLGKLNLDHWVGESVVVTSRLDSHYVEILQLDKTNHRSNP